jgi:acetyl-CoA carboxylase carboxyl transferase subunit alpha
MANVILEFEKPVAELEARLEAWENPVDGNAAHTEEEIKELKKLLEELKESVYDNLTPW